MNDCSGCPVPKGINSVIAKKRMDMEKAESCWKTGDDDGFSNLPYVVLTEIFNKLDSTDRLNASAVCKNWRQHLFHPRYWSTVQFPITRKHLKKTRFFTQAFGNIVSNATVIMNSSSKDCLRELCILLQTFAKNNNLKSLMIKPITHGFERPSKKNNSSCGSFLEKEIAKQLNKCLPKLEKFCLGCVGDLPLCLDNILENLNPSLLTALGVATTNLPVRYHCGCFDPRLLIRLSKLQELSIDSKQLTYRLLENLEHVKTLTKIIVYVHKHHELVFLYQPLMSFKEKHPVLTVKIRWRRVQEDW